MTPNILSTAKHDTSGNCVLKKIKVKKNTKFSQDISLFSIKLTADADAYTFVDEQHHGTALQRLVARSEVRKLQEFYYVPKY